MKNWLSWLVFPISLHSNAFALTTTTGRGRDSNTIVAVVIAKPSSQDFCSGDTISLTQASIPIATVTTTATTLITSTNTLTDSIETATMTLYSDTTTITVHTATVTDTTIVSTSTVLMFTATVVSTTYSTTITTVICTSTILSNQLVAATVTSIESLYETVSSLITTTTFSDIYADSGVKKRDQVVRAPDPSFPNSDLLHSPQDLEDSWRRRGPPKPMVIQSGATAASRFNTFVNTAFPSSLLVQSAATPDSRQAVALDVVLQNQPKAFRRNPPTISAVHSCVQRPRPYPVADKTATVTVLTSQVTTVTKTELVIITTTTFAPFPLTVFATTTQVIPIISLSVIQVVSTSTVTTDSITTILTDTTIYIPTTTTDSSTITTTITTTSKATTIVSVTRTYTNVLGPLNGCPFLPLHGQIDHGAHGNFGGHDGRNRYCASACDNEPGCQAFGINLFAGYYTDCYTYSAVQNPGYYDVLFFCGSYANSDLDVYNLVSESRTSSVVGDAGSRM